MSQGKWRLAVKGEFSASHCLTGHGGKCESLHGHNFSVVVEVEGSEIDPVTGMLVDFSELKRFLKEILGELDHHHLNDTPMFRELSPSSENISRHIYKAMAARMGEGPARLAAVTVSEKAAQSATYMEE